MLHMNPAPGIIMPRAAEPANPVSAAGSSGLFSAAMRDSGTYRAGQKQSEGEATCKQCGISQRGRRSTGST